jgi:hypothetical protein
MESFLDNYIAKNGSTSVSTKKTLKTSLRRLEKVLKLPFDEWNKNTFDNVNEIINVLSEDYSVNTIILTILAIIRYLEVKDGKEKILNEYKEILNEIIGERTKEEHSQKSDENEKVNWIDYETLKDKVEKMAEEYLTKKKSFTKYRNFLILSLFSLQPPTRIGNYLDMKIKMNGKKDIKSLNKKFNYITKNDGKYRMIFNKYKTSKYLGKIDYTIENETLNKLLDKWLEDYNNTDTLFINVNKKPMTQPNFTQAQQSITKNVLGKTLTSNSHRHIYLTWFLKQNPSIEEKKKVARLVGQTYRPSRMELYERKDIKEDENVIEI